MKTAKKRHDARGGWETTVTMDDGTEVTVELHRGGYKRNWFGHASHYWHARVSGPGWSLQFAAGQGESAQRLARRALRRRAELDKGE